MYVLLGGSGFIGQHLRQALASQEMPCAVVTRTPESCSPAAGPLENLLSLADFEGPDGTALIMQATVIVYLVSSSVPGTFTNEPWREIEANVNPAVRCLWRIAKTNPLAKIVFISSGGTIYGDQPDRLTTELTAAAPASGYGLGKLMIEESLRFISQSTGILHAILRVSNPLGRYQTSATQGIVAIAIRAAVNRTSINLFDEGRQVRDYIDADDVADAIILAGEHGSEAGTWNIGSGLGHSTASMLALVETITGEKIHVEFKPRRKVDISHIVLDIALARRQLGWSPTRPIDATIAHIHNLLVTAPLPLQRQMA